MYLHAHYSTGAAGAKAAYNSKRHLHTDWSSSVKEGEDPGGGGSGGQNRRMFTSAMWASSLRFVWTRGEGEAALLDLLSVEI